MSNVASFSVESQTGNKEVVSVCHINMKSLSLEISDIANILFKNNIEMFNRINNASKITSMKLIRHSVVKGKMRSNKLSTRIISPLESHDEEIAVLSFTDGILEKKSRYRWPSGKTSDVSLRSLLVASKKNILNTDQPTLDDIKSAQIICTSKEIRLFQNLGVKTFLFTDNLFNKENVVELAYTLEVRVQTVFKDYITNNISKLEKSINFVRSYLNQIQNGNLYNHESENYIQSFIKENFGAMGIEYPFVTLDTQQNRDAIGNSSFGTVGKNLYNSKLLLTKAVPLSLYDQTVLDLLPIKTSNPHKVSKVLKDLESTLSDLQKTYLKTKSSINDRGKTSVSMSKNTTNTLVLHTKENFEFDNDDIGYNIFSNARSMPEFTISQMKKRVQSESRRYCSALDNPGKLPNLVNNEKAQFTNKSSTFGFLTPIGIKDGKDLLDTSRGIFSLSPEEVNTFRMKKAIKSSAKKANRYTKSVSQNKVGSTAAGTFNLSIGKPIKSALQVKRSGEVDPYVDAKEYFGDSSTFIINKQFSDTDDFKKRFKKLNKTNRKILSRMVPRAFLTNKSKINSTKQLSIKDRDSKISKAILKGAISVDSIPPQIRALALAPPPKPAQNDPIRNFKTAGIIEETQMNVYSIRAMVGFNRDEKGFLNMNSPIFKTLDLSTLDSDRPVLAFADNYEIPEVGLLKDISPATIYNRMIYIRGRRPNGSQ